MLCPASILGAIKTIYLNPSKTTSHVAGRELNVILLALTEEGSG